MALGDKERFADFKAVAVTLPRVEQAFARVEAAMKPGADRKTAVENLTDLRDALRDFAAR